MKLLRERWRSLHLNCMFKKITKELGWKPKFNSIDEMIIHYNWIKNLKNIKNFNVKEYLNIKIIKSDFFLKLGTVFFNLGIFLLPSAFFFSSIFLFLS